MEEKPLKITVLKSASEYELREKSSLFIAAAFPVYGEDDFDTRLQAVKKEHYKARHHCYAFRLPAGERYSDAGEPSGTAGIRILNTIDHFKLQYTGVIVTRYFGGIKLGAGPLGKAYYEAAYGAIADATKKELTLCVKLTISAPLEEQHNIYNLLSRFQGRNIETHFGEEVIFQFVLLKERHAEFNRAVTDMYKIRLTAGEEFYA
ncbi:MAG: YigZ family protein [Ignavibacteriaceae bacterium]|nr:YigZ family protein [Ignavibacteriaceae bacterium]